MQKARFAILAALAYFTMMSYAIARNPIDSIFLQHNTSAGLPLAWVLTAFGAALTIAVYNRFNAKYSMLKIFSAASIISMLLLSIILLLFDVHQIVMSYILYVWKEMYIVVLVEVFWSYADLTFSIKSARKLYGILLAFGSAGGISGSLLIGPLARSLGTQSTLWVLACVLIICALVAQLTGKKLGDPVPTGAARQKNSLSDAFKLLLESKYLFYLLLVVFGVQMATALIDYSYNGFLETAFTNIDERTAAMGKIHAVIDLTSVVLQLGTGAILRWIGVAGTLLAIPSLVGAAIGAFFIVPQVALIVLMRMTSKSLDYSLFRAAKEILYIPLSRAEKTQGKAVIDILAYRLGKGTASLILMLMIQAGVAAYSLPLAFVFVLMWLLLTFVICKRYRSLVSFDEELALHSK